MRKLKLELTSVFLLLLSLNLYAASDTKKKIFSIMSGLPSSEYKYSQDLYYLAQLQPRLEASIGKKLSDDLALAVAACISSATHPDNPDTVLLGVIFNRIESEKAIALCELAYSFGGNNIGMVLTSMSRAYNKAARHDQSLRFAREAVALGYPFGDVMMAIHYAYGNGTKKNARQSFAWYKKAAQKGITAAMRVTAENYLEGKGTKKDIVEALYWSRQAVSNNDGKGFYQLGNVLEALANTKANRYKLLALAKDVYHLASYNGVYVGRDLNRISQLINPNSIHNNAILAQAKLTGHVTDGIFFPNEVDSYWYLGDALFSQGSNQYAYARVRHSNSVFTLWSTYSATTKQTEWYADFLYAGNSKVKSFEYLAVTDKRERKIRLNISNPLLKQLAGSYRMTAKLHFNDVIYLLNARSVRFAYTRKKSNKIVSYSLPLNQETTQAAEHQKHSAKQVIAKLVIKAKKQNKKCCNLTGLAPLDRSYDAFQYLCSSKQSDLNTSNRMNYNCDRLALYGTEKDRSNAVEGTYMEHHVPNLFDRIDHLITL